MVSFYYLCWLLVIQVRPGGAGAAVSEVIPDAAADGGAAGGGGPFGDLSYLWLMVGVMMLIFLFVMPRQQQKEKAQVSEMLDNLKKNDEIVTAGGIRGTVVNLREGGEYVTIRIDENTNTKMKILKKSVIRVLSGDDNKSD